MVSLDNEIRLANMLTVVGEGEMSIEQIRQRLAKQAGFDPYTLFRVLDKSGKGFITCDEVQFFLAYACMTLDSSILFSAATKSQGCSTANHRTSD